MKPLSNARWAALAVFVVAAPLLRAADYTQTINKNLTFRGGRVSIEHSFGNVSVTTHSGNSVSVNAVVRASDADFGKRIKVIATESPNGIIIRTEYPETAGDYHIRIGRHTSSSFAVDYAIAIPENAPLSVRNRFGNVSASGLRAASEISNAQGNVTIHGGVGAQSIENTFGSIEATDLAGDAVVRNANGPIKVEHVKGSLQVTNRFGPVRVKRCRTRRDDQERQRTRRGSGRPRIGIADHFVRTGQGVGRSRRTRCHRQQRSGHRVGHWGPLPRSKARSRRCARRISPAS